MRNLVISTSDGSAEYYKAQLHNWLVSPSPRDSSLNTRFQGIVGEG